MKKKKTTSARKTDELRSEYDFSKMGSGVRGKYAGRYKGGTNLVLLSPDVAAHFPDDRSVNTTLRKIIRSSKRTVRRSH